MGILTAKARQIIEYGLDEIGDFEQRKTWNAWAQAHPAPRGPETPWQKRADQRLPIEVVKVAIYMLEYAAQRKRRALKYSARSEDDVAEIENDLTYIRTVADGVLQNVPERVE
jgi:hypothetical protein